MPNGDDEARARAEDEHQSRKRLTAQGVREFKRTYKACVLCRKSKAKCDVPLNPDGSVSSGPCVKCRRERRECQFPATRATKRSREEFQQDETMNSEQGGGIVIETPGHVQEGWSSSQRQTETFMNHSGQNANNDHGGNTHGFSHQGYQQQQASFDDRDHVAIPKVQFPSQSNNVQTGVIDNDDTNSIDTASFPRPRSQSMTQRSVLNNSVMRTMITSSNDALGLLFQAAEQPNQAIGTGQSESSTSGIHKNTISMQHHTPHSAVSIGAISSPIIPETLSDASLEVLRLWNRCRFVKQGWFSAREAVTYVDFLSPILTDDYADHSRHVTLVTEEPLLTCVILMISSRVHTLPGMGGSSRAHFIHCRLWGHAEHLISRVIFGQEKFSTARTRTLGTIESFLLITEWHPRSLHFPPHSDGWDFDLLAPDGEGPEVSEDGSAIYRWREDVFEPAKRSDRMSWMILGAATTLAHELGIFSTENSQEELQKNDNLRKLRVRMLLYVYVNQLAARIGCTTLIPENVSSSLLDRSSLPHMTLADQQWYSFMTSWIEITKLMETVNDMFFSSPAFTKNLLLSGRYKGLLKHFQPLLEQWNMKATKLEGQPKAFRDIMFLEYHYIRMYINSLSIQAVVERSLAQHVNANSMSSDGSTPFPPSRDDLVTTSITPTDYNLTAEVIDASVQILKKTVSLAQSGTLKFAPVRVYLRVVSASIFLLKAISLGARQHDLQISLGVLDECIQALQMNTVDEMHLCSRYGTLLERHVARFRRNFVGTFQSGGASATHLPQPIAGFTQVNQMSGIFDQDHAGSSRSREHEPQQVPQGLLGGMGDMPELQGLDGVGTIEDWLAQPFDPGIAPFGLGDSQQLSGLELGSLDFLWNLPSV
ncbi:hypothetical protein BP5796_09344 [Coleophoma crateriformis]|uniref:Zn(2)-C6 fungal-type domain-containing protein n=1 Tax=Coleophoma crateriformis TaxID=565419 RepID=A0A3D8QXV1_9HELO|nr:hypothetical protein BP5796_09344 [Coleophoma crateriformis]